MSNTPTICESPSLNLDALPSDAAQAPIPAWGFTRSGTVRSDEDAKKMAMRHFGLKVLDASTFDFGSGFNFGLAFGRATVPVAPQAGGDAAQARDAARYRLIRAGFGDFGPDADLHNALVDDGEKLDAALDKLLPDAAPVPPAAAAPSDKHAGLETAAKLSTNTVVQLSTETVDKPVQSMSDATRDAHGQRAEGEA